jgi:signal transduction histidine kinase
VLVVDDRAEDRMMVRRLLRGQKRPYTIIEARTGEEGLAQCRAVHPDCMLLDFCLPDRDGNELLELLRQSSGRTVPVPVVMLTGVEDDESAAEALKLGAQDYLPKDALSGHGLARAIENAIEKFQIRRELEEQRAAVELRNHRLEALRDELQARMLELGDATRAKERFLAVMSHEMRTPLNAILGYTDLLDMELDGELTDGQRQQLERIRVGSRHLLDLTNDVLDLTRADASKLDLDIRPIDVRAVFEEVVALLEREAAAKGIELVAESGEPAPPLVLADLQRFRQIITNLIGNALKFTDHGTVRVRCLPARADGMVPIQVVDTGIGIDPDVQPLIFNEFYQAKGELTRRHGGSGLGLAISRRLAQLMGGDIQVESREGEGSTFTLLLRSAGEGSERRQADVALHDARMAAHVAASVRRSAYGSVTVVAFGREVAALEELERRVRPSVRLVWTTDADAVATLARAEHAALAVLDAGSTDGLAWRAAHAIQADPELASTAVLLLPSIPAALPEESAEVLDLGWVSLVPKPFSAEQLMHAVSAAADSLHDEHPDGQPPRRCTVLVVDDDSDSRRVAARFLTGSQVEVLEAVDGETALVEMRRHPPDVVVLDLMMPVLDGFGVLAAMRTDPLLAGIPVVVLTAKNLSEPERQFLSRTAARVLQKGAHRLADVASLVLRAAARARQEGVAAATSLAEDAIADA